MSTPRTTRRPVTWLLSTALTLSAAGVVAGPATAAADRTDGQVAIPTSAAAAAAASAPTPGTSPFGTALDGKYVDPDRVYSTDIRWWLGDAANTDESLLEEIQGLYDAGFRGVELCMQNDAGAPDATYAYGSPSWEHKWNLMMNKLLDLGMGVYLTSGTNWSTSNVPGLDPTSQSAMQNLTLGTSTVAPGTAVTTLPAPATTAQRAGASFVTAYAYKTTDGGTTLDPSSYVNLKPQVVQGASVWDQKVTWTVPDDGTYRIFAMWTEGTYQSSSPATTPSYATNYFDARGVAALRAFWEKHYLADPALRAKIAKGDVQLFMDSLEINFGTGGMTWWAEDMAAEFKKRKGYDITPYLFLVNGITANVRNPYDGVDTTGTYKLAGDDKVRQGIVNDWQDVLTQLYRERMLQPMKQWLNSVGIETRAQISYGKPLEISEPSMDVDYPEAENFNQYNQVDIFRLWTGAAKLENKVLSTETGAEMSVNGTRKTNLHDAYSAFDAGFQRIVWHIWGAGYGYGSFQYPGYGGTGGFQYWGSRNPESADYDELNAHVGRVQQLLQTGESRTDVGFIHQNWAQGIRFGGGVGNDNTQMDWEGAHQGVYYRSTELQDNGYTYDYFSPRFLFDDDVHFDPKTKTVEKAGYQALVLYQNWLDLDAAKKILSWSKQGLPVVILENAGNRTPFNDGKSSALAKVMAELKTLPTVRQATVYDNIDYFSATPGGYDDNVLEKLRELGVDPYAGYTKPNHQLLSQLRQDADGNRYLYLHNYDDGKAHQYSWKPEVRKEDHGTHITTEVAVDGTYVPFTIDPWTGESTELAGYRWENGKTVVPVDLDYDDIALMAFEKVDKAPVHVVSTNAASTYAQPGSIAVRATDTGTVATTLSDGTTYQDQVAVPAPYDITDWNLTVQSWTPNPTAGDLTRTETIDGLTTVNRKTSTIKTPISVTLPTMTTWDNIPQVGKAVSGTGHYAATFDWDASKATGATLDFGDKLEASMTVTINGHHVGGDPSTNPTKRTQDVGGVGKPTIDDGTGKQVPLVGKPLYTGGIGTTDPSADITKYLVDGKNTITIDYSSALVNSQIARGAVRESLNAKGWLGFDIRYLSFGPQMAKIVPYVDVVHPTVPGTTAPSGPGTPAGPGTTPTTPASARTSLDGTVKPGKVVAGRTKAKVRIQAVSSDASQVPGTVTVTVNGNTRIVTLSGGRAVVKLPVFKRVGTKKVTITYAATPGHQATSTVVTVKVRRR